MKKLKLAYDNFEDAKTKLVGTFCMYKGKAVVVKAVIPKDEDPTKYRAVGSYMFNGRSFEADIDDPDFNCSEFNIGYCTTALAGTWFYRSPVKQWKQGLRSDQVRCRSSQQKFNDVSFNSNKYLCTMLENTYPSFQHSAGLLRSEGVPIAAFHKNFAMSFDPIHKDYILEYKGRNIGFTNNLKDMKLMDEYQHLTESLKEAVG